MTLTFALDKITDSPRESRIINRNNHMDQHIRQFWRVASTGKKEGNLTSLIFNLKWCSVLLFVSMGGLSYINSSHSVDIPHQSPPCPPPTSDFSTNCSSDVSLLSFRGLSVAHVASAQMLATLSCLLFLTSPWVSSTSILVHTYTFYLQCLYGLVYHYLNDYCINFTFCFLSLLTNGSILNIDAACHQIFPHFEEPHLQFEILF